jgi:hypothetical protein
MPKKAPAKKTTFGADLIEGMKLVLAHQRCKIELEQVWQGGRQPDSAARAYLTVIAKEPAAVRRALAIE